MELYKDRENFNTKNTKNFLTIIKQNLEAAISKLILELNNFIIKLPKRVRLTILDNLQDLPLIYITGFLHS